MIQPLKKIPQVYDDTLTQNAAPYVVDEVIKQLSPNIKDLKTGGYKIILNIDLDVQNMAQNALKFGYDEIVKRDKDANLSTLNGAMVVVNHQSGDVLALVGGVDYEKVIITVLLKVCVNLEALLNLLCIKWRLI